MQTTTELGSEAATGGLLAAMGALWFVYFVLIVVLIVAQWKIFTKAGKPGWAAIIPIYNVIVLLEIVGRPLWWVILFFIPIVQIVILFMVMLDLSRAFGHDMGFALGLFFLSFIFMLILGFGDSRYVGPAGSAAAAPPMPTAPPSV